MQVPSILVDETTVHKISHLTPNIGIVYSGMGPDCRVLVRKARKQAQAYYRLYHDHIPVAQLVRELAAVMQEYTRAYSLALLLSPPSPSHSQYQTASHQFSRKHTPSLLPRHPRTQATIIHKEAFMRQRALAAMTLTAVQPTKQAVVSCH